MHSESNKNCTLHYNLICQLVAEDKQQLHTDKSPMELAMIMAGSPVGVAPEPFSKDSSLEVVVSPTSPLASPAPEVPQLPIASLEELSGVLGTEVISFASSGAGPGIPTPTSIAPSASEDEWAEETGSDGDQDVARNANAFELSDSTAFGIEAADETAAHLFDRQHPSAVPKDADLRLVFQHRSRKTVHFGHITSEAILACKTPRSAMHIQVFGEVKNLFPKCQWCFP